MAPPAAGERRAVHRDGAGIRCEQAAQQVGQRGLAGARRSGDGDELVGGDGEVDALQGKRVGRRIPVGERHAAQCQFAA